MIKALGAWYHEWGVDEVWHENGLATHPSLAYAADLGQSAFAAMQEASTQSPSAQSPSAQKLQETVQPSPLQMPEGGSKTSLLSITSLEDLKNALEYFEACPLKETALHTVFADGNPSARVMLVGEAPGADEDRLGKPFVGLSGQLLDSMLAAIGLDRTSVYISNIVPWRPPGNRPPTSAEITACLPFIERHISLIQPELLLIIGGTAAKSLLQTPQGITRLRGQWIAYQNPYLPSPMMALATFHPAYLLRSPGQKREAWKDLLKFKKQLRENANA